VTRGGDADELVTSVSPAPLLAKRKKGWNRGGFRSRFGGRSAQNAKYGVFIETAKKKAADIVCSLPVDSVWLIHLYRGGGAGELVTSVSPAPLPAAAARTSAPSLPWLAASMATGALLSWGLHACVQARLMSQHQLHHV
jgi:hypothetical protein